MRHHSNASDALRGSESKTVADPTSVHLEGSETADERERRLAHQQEYNRRRAVEENAEQRERRLAQQRAYSRQRAAEGNSEQREQRLARQREYNRNRRVSSAPTSNAIEGERHPDSHPASVQETNEQRLSRLAHQRESSRRHREQERANCGNIELEDVSAVDRTSSIVFPQARNVGMTHERTTLRTSLTHDCSSIHVEPLESDAASLAPISHHQRRLVEEQLQAALGADLDECVCALCDRLVLRKSLRAVHSGHTALLVSMQRVLKTDGHNLSPSLASQDECGDLDHVLQGEQCFYSDVEVDYAEIRAIENDTHMFDRLLTQDDDIDVATAVDEEQASLPRQSGDAVLAEGEEECSVIERNSLLLSSEVAANATYAQRVVDLNAHEPSATPRLRVIHSSQFASRTEIEAKMYPHLFPFGLSRRDCIGHYVMLSSRRFAQDLAFMLTSFARLALENMYTLTSVKCRRYGSIFQGYEALSHEDVAAALLDNERRQRGESRQGLPNPDAARVLKSVELGSVSVWGSNAERRQCRRDAFGYQTRFGQPSLFVTLTPNTDNSYAMAHYTGILSVETLFDVLEARIPSMTEMKQAAMMDDCASARLFMRIVDAFISSVLGVDPNTSQSTQDGGLFGKTKASFGMVETQGRETLHIHFLIWLSGAQVNSAAFERKVVEQGDSYVRGLEEYVDSIVTTQLPVSVDQVMCVRCETPGSYSSLPIPTSARREKSRRKSLNQVERVLAVCSVCGEECSAQHVLRRALLRIRSPHWPPSLKQLSSDEIEKRTQQEARARLSVAEAAVRLADREMFLASLSRDESD